MKITLYPKSHQARGWRLFPHLAWIVLGLVWLSSSQELCSATSNSATATAGPTFTKITTGPLVTDRGSSGMAAYADYDNDGYLDLHVGRFWGGRSTLYHNNGDGTFTGVTNSVFPLARAGVRWRMGGLR